MTFSKNKQYIGKIVIKGVEEVRVFGPTLKATITELNHYIEQYKLEGPMDIAVFKEGFDDPIAVVEQETPPSKRNIKPTEKELAMIANAYCRLQFGIKKCSECPAFNCACSWLREKIVPITAVAFAIDAWNRREK